MTGDDALVWEREDEDGGDNTESDSAGEESGGSGEQDKAQDEAVGAAAGGFRATSVNAKALQLGRKRALKENRTERNDKARKMDAMMEEVANKRRWRTSKIYFLLKFERCDERST